MDMHLILSALALLAATASLVYAVYAKRSVSSPLDMPVTDRVCVAWNAEYPVGTWIALDAQTVDKTAGRCSARTLSAAYVKDGKSVVDVEQFGRIELSGRVHAISDR